MIDSYTYEVREWKIKNNGKHTRRSTATRYFTGLPHHLCLCI